MKSITDHEEGTGTWETTAGAGATQRRTYYGPRGTCEEAGSRAVGGKQCKPAQPRRRTSGRIYQMTREHDLCLHVQDAASRNAWICKRPSASRSCRLFVGARGAVSPQLNAQALHSESSRRTRSASCRPWWCNPVLKSENVVSMCMSR